MPRATSAALVLLAIVAIAVGVGLIVLTGIASPLAGLIVTIAGGCLFGTIGLVLAAPLVSAAVKISADLAGARAAAERDARETPAPGPGPEAPEPGVA